MMYRFNKFVLTGALGLLLTSSSYAGQAKGGGTGGTGGGTGTAGGGTQQGGTQQGGTTGGTQQGGTTGGTQQGGTTGGTQPPVQGKQLPPNSAGQGAQPPANLSLQGKQTNQIPPGILSNGTMSQTPWFNDPGVQKHLGLTDAQMNQLKQSYGQHYNQYTKGLADNSYSKGLGATGNQNNLGTVFGGNDFNSQMLNSAQGVLNANQMQRFSQLHMQAQGLGAFNNAQVAKQLNLTADQTAKLNAFAQQQSQQMSGINMSDPQAAAKQYQTLRQQNDQFLNSLLNAQQQQTFRQLIGDPYNFTPITNPK
jgi:hypothetical protein